MISSVEMMLERWKNHQGKEIDVSEEFRLLTSEVISRTAFGSSYLEGKKRFSIEDLVDECKTFYIAGQETSSTMLGWTVLLLAIHIDWQEAARKEVINLFGNQNPHLDGITKLKTVIKSTIKLLDHVYRNLNKKNKIILLVDDHDHQ